MTSEAGLTMGGAIDADVAGERKADQEMTIGGRGVAGTAPPVDVIDPATGRVFGAAPRCSRAQLDEAVQAARTAAPGWAALAFDERKRRVAAIADVIRDHGEELAALLTREQGKPSSLAAGEVAGAAAWAAAVADLDLPTEERGDDGRRVRVRRLPVGVVAAIVPWNYPLLSALMKIAPALAAGNAVVLKPAPTTPLTTLRLGALLRDVLPPGVLNVVSGDDELGPWLVSHEGIDKVSFTGSTATGKKIMAAAAGRLTRVTLELGGNDAAIVLPDADVEAVAARLFWGAMLNSGQICVAAKRVYVHESIFQPFADAMLRLARATRMGPGDQAGIELGPIQNRTQFERVRGLASRARDAGLTVVEGRAPEIEHEGGFFHPVTLVLDPPEDAEVVQEEAFGPILPILRFRDVDDAVARANGTRFGLGGSVWSRDAAAAADVADRLECGVAWVNTIMDSPPDQPLGGHKESGVGVESGLLGLLEYTKVQSRVVVPA